MSRLRYLFLSPESAGKPERLMVFLHGYGSHGWDFLDAARSLRQEFPQMGFLLPDAPTPIPLSAEWIAQMDIQTAFQWFALGDLLSESANADAKRKTVQKGVQEAFPIIETFLNEMAELYDCPLSQMILLGFSQGAMIALDAALRLKLKGGIACAGMLAFADDFDTHYTINAPILLCHGEADDVVPDSGSREAHQILQAKGADVTLHLSPHTAHHLDPSMIQAFKNFIGKIS